jgi:hypothetical protein
MRREKIKLKKKTLIYLSLLWLLLFCLVFLFEYNEIMKAKEYCESIKKQYTFKIIHICDGEPIYKYSINGKQFWSYEIPKLNNISLNWSIVDEYKYK